MSLRVEELQNILIEAGIEADKRNVVLKLAREAEEEAKASKEAEGDENKNKYRFVVLVRGDEETQKRVAGGAWLTQIVEDDDGTSLQRGLISAAARQNELANRPKKGKQGRKAKGGIIKSWVELFNWLKPKTLNEVTNKGVKIKSKMPVEVQVLETEDVPFEK